MSCWQHGAALRWRGRLKASRCHFREAPANGADQGYEATINILLRDFVGNWHRDPIVLRFTVSMLVGGFVAVEGGVTVEDALVMEALVEAIVG